MVTIRTTNDLVLSLLDYFRVSMPDASMNPGSVIRDLFVDAPSSQIALLYDELAKISNLQSLRIVSGNDLDRLAQNYGMTRKSATSASGIALYTFSSLPAVVAINTGDITTAVNGATFSVVNGISVNPSQANAYKAIAIKYQNNLSFLNITDTFAVEVSVQATSPGTSGNIPQYAINSSQTPGVSNVTNISPFTGGNNQEDDATFRNRVLGIFSGSNIGTALGYRNTALSNNLVGDAAVIGPGNPLMTRDGTQVEQNANGSLTIVSAGTGGKVDVVILGQREAQFTDTYIYQDQSNRNDPTNPANNHILGQIVADAGLTVTQKRVIDIANGVLPAQPVDQILSVTGSKSGANFIPETVDVFGRVSGNFKLIKDTGAYEGSPWGFDALAWVNNQISFNEDIVKSQFNGQDATTFSSVLQIPKIQQNIQISNENSQVSTTDQSIIQLLHTPATNVTRVFNVNTGERYTVINQNLNGTGTVNTGGLIQISGNTLPTSSTTLQVDYTWIVSYDPFSDYDGKILNNNPRPSNDSVDWGLSNAIRNERILFTANGTNTLYTGTSKELVSTIIRANMFSTTNGVVSASVVPNFTDRLAIVLSNLDAQINSVENIKLKNTEEEIYFTAENDGQIINTAVVVGLLVKYNVTIILPTDTPAILGQYINIIYNQVDVSSTATANASFVGNQITIPVSNIPTTSPTIYLDTTYLAAAVNITSFGVTNLPISRAGNGFTLNSNTGSTNAIKSNTMRRENQTIQQNGLSLFVTLSISSTTYSLIASQVISVIDLRTFTEIWNASHIGTVSTSNGNYTLTFSGYNSPQVGDNVLVIYFADPQLDIQPFTFLNGVFSKAFETLLFNSATNVFYTPINNFTIESGLSFSIVDTTTGDIIASANDGYIASLSNNNLNASFGSLSVPFAVIDDITGKNIAITSSANLNNLGTYSIIGEGSTGNTITIATIVSNLNQNQVSIIRIADGKDLWNASLGTIDATNNVLLLPSTTAAIAGDKVMVILYTNKNLHQAPTKIAVTTTDQINNPGILTVLGTTATQAANVVFIATQNGLQQNLLSAMKTFLGLNSVSSISSNSYLIRVVQLSKISITTGNVVLSTLATFDIEGTQILNNLFYVNEMLFNSSLSNFDFILPSSTNNINNAPKIGDALQVTFYYATDGYSENLNFSRNGTLYTNNKFATIERMFASSGFTASQSTNFLLSYFTQPAASTRYTTYYNYLAPQENERIVIQYNYNALISDITFAIEANRPITADVLVREDKEVLIDVTANIIVSPNSTDSANIVIQNVQNKLTATINSNVLGGTLSLSDIITAAQTVDNVQSVQVIYFNQDGYAGTSPLLTAQQNQQFVANTVLVNQIS